MSLAEARERALANRKIAQQGGDPLAATRRALGIPTFEEAAGKVIKGTDNIRVESTTGAVAVGGGGSRYRRLSPLPSRACTSSTTASTGSARRAARLRAEGLPLPGEMGPEGVSAWLGAPRFRDEEIAARTRRPGVALGLAATGEGGDVLLVEAACLPGRGNAARHRDGGADDEGVGERRDDVGALARRAPRRRRQVRRYDGRARAPGRGRPVEGRPVGGGWRWPSPWSRR